MLRLCTGSHVPWGLLAAASLAALLCSRQRFPRAPLCARARSQTPAVIPRPCLACVGWQPGGLPRWRFFLPRFSCAVVCSGQLECLASKASCTLRPGHAFSPCISPSSSHCIFFVLPGMFRAHCNSLPSHVLATPRSCRCHQLSSRHCRALLLFNQARLSNLCLPLPVMVPVILR